MMKKYLFNLMMLMALAVVAVSCSNDSEWNEEKAVSHAENVLGFTIDPAQNWKMTATATANVTVNKLLGETYTVAVYANNPLVDSVATVLASGSIMDGETFTQTFDYASALTSLFVGITDEDGYTFCKRVNVENGVINTTFGESAAASARRSQTVPSVPDIDAPYDEAWVTTYCETATEPNKDNAWDNYDNRTWVGGQESQWVVDVPATTTKASVGQVQWGGLANSILWGIPQGWFTIADNDPEKVFFEQYCRPVVNYQITDYNNNDILNAYIDLVETAYQKCKDTNRNDWMSIYGNWVKGTTTEEQGHWTEATEGYWKEDPNFVRNFKITGTWNGDINVVATEGYTDGVANGNQRTVVVKGTWNLTADQKVGSLGRIIIANGGKLNISSDKQLQMVNQAQLVVLPGGEINGGNIEVSNGNDAGFENYNGGTINVAKFNNNFGKFYNYGPFTATEYDGGAQESNFYNHNIVKIANTGSSSNARIFNNCQWYCTGDMRARNYEGKGGSALIVDGQLMFSGSEDGTTDASYVGLADGALVQCGSLHNTNTGWTGPTSGYAVLSMGQIAQLDWDTTNGAQEAGYFENNIYVHADTWTNIPKGSGKHQSDPNDEQNYSESIASYKFFNIVANCRGNGGVTKVTKSNSGNWLIDKDEGFKEGEKGCTPGFEGTAPEIKKENQIFSYAFEDSWNADYDMNDVVVKVQMHPTKQNFATFTLCCTGASYDLSVYIGNIELFKEVHASFGLGGVNKFVNTGSGDKFVQKTVLPFQDVNIANYSNGSDKSAGLGSLNIWIKSPEKAKISVATEGEDPHAVVIPGDWRWPKEWTSIKEAYPQFVDFAKDATHQTNADWYNYPEEDKVY